MIDLPVEGIRLVLPFATPSQNVYMRWHWSRRAQLRDTARLLVRSQLRAMGLRMASAPVRAAVEFMRIGRRQLDYGNIVGGGMKNLLDALVREGVIHGDEPRWVKELYHQERAGSRPEQTRIWVYPTAERYPGW